MWLGMKNRKLEFFCLPRTRCSNGSKCQEFAARCKSDLLKQFVDNLRRAALEGPFRVGKVPLK